MESWAQQTCQLRFSRIVGGMDWKFHRWPSPSAQLLVNSWAARSNIFHIIFTKVTDMDVHAWWFQQQLSWSAQVLSPLWSPSLSVSSMPRPTDQYFVPREVARGQGVRQTGTRSPAVFTTSYSWYSDNPWENQILRPLTICGQVYEGSHRRRNETKLVEAAKKWCTRKPKWATKEISNCLS